MKNPPPFPGLLTLGSPDAASVRRVQTRLLKLGFPANVTGLFDKATESIVKAMQASRFDTLGQPLVVDGKVGPITWAALFPASPPLPQAALSGMADAVIAVARGEVGVAETPGKPNRGPRVDEFVRFVGLDPAGGHDWCVCFLQWCFNTAATKLGVGSPMPFRPDKKGNATKLREPGVLNLWRLAAQKGTPVLRPDDDPATLALRLPGSVFILDRGGGLGHAGLVVAYAGQRLHTIEGNSNVAGSGNGGEVVEVATRKLSSISRGFILYS